jgi:hypothetical protein
MDAAEVFCELTAVTEMCWLAATCYLRVRHRHLRLRPGDVVVVDQLFAVA